MRTEEGDLVSLEKIFFLIGGRERDGLENSSDKFYHEKELRTSQELKDNVESG